MPGPTRSMNSRTSWGTTSRTTASSGSIAASPRRSGSRWASAPRGTAEMAGTERLPRQTGQARAGPMRSRKRCQAHPRTRYRPQRPGSAARSPPAPQGAPERELLGMLEVSPDRWPARCACHSRPEGTAAPSGPGPSAVRRHRRQRPRRARGQPGCIGCNESPRPEPFAPDPRRHASAVTRPPGGDRTLRVTSPL